jgi:LmbE family N-acetylglucosaminyl deacetylase
MPVADTDFLTAQMAAPAALLLWRALQPLRGLARFMTSGAHPDDEQSGLLAALSYRDGLSLSCVCATRGEGGQNEIGRESGALLGALRSMEMARAADVLGMDLYWLGASPEDPIHDFGFSKSGTDTLARWGRDATLARFVAAIRADRPDILCPTFLDIPGQHGHHRAMTELAHAAVAAAADPAFDAPGRPWQVAKLYLPAWSGAGDAYDDDLPPPPASVEVPGRGREPVSGWTWHEIGQHSRRFHATQGMGRRVGPAEGPGWPLHLAVSAVGPDAPGTAAAITDNLPARYADLDPRLQPLDAAVAAVVAAWPDTGAVARAAARALEALADGCAQLGVDPAAGAADADWPEAHRLARLRARLARVWMLAAGVRAEGRLAQAELRPGERVAATLALAAPEGVAAELAWDLPTGWQATDPELEVPSDAAPFDAYAMHHTAHGPTGPVALRLTLRAGGAEASLRLPVDPPALVLPAVEASVSPSALFCNARAPRPLALDLSPGAALAVPVGGWQLAAGRLHPPPSPAEGLHHLPVTRNGAPARDVLRSRHPHTGPLVLPVPAAVRLRVADVALPEGRVAYVGGGNDRVDHWLAAMGARVTALTDAALPSALPEADTLVVGLFALRTRPALRAALPAIHRWVAAGGNLVTLYHRPWDAWDPERSAPARLEIGKPSLRFRVTDPAARVTHLERDHPLLCTPNPIGAEDWAGWVKERGLYFARSWDAAYRPLLSMADPGEAPHEGALLSGRFGAGRHSHCALTLHHQMENLVPGAFRLMANLIAPAR